MRYQLSDYAEKSLTNCSFLKVQHKAVSKKGWMESLTHVLELAYFVTLWFEFLMQYDMDTPILQITGDVAA